MQPQSCTLYKYQYRCLLYAWVGLIVTSLGSQQIRFSLYSLASPFHVCTEDTELMMLDWYKLPPSKCQIIQVIKWSFQISLSGIEIAVSVHIQVEKYSSMCIENNSCNEQVAALSQRPIMYYNTIQYNMIKYLWYAMWYDVYVIWYDTLWYDMMQ